ncbi:hypothetical protein [Mycobacterium sp. OTB74]|uniref:hypothetical protein n=1 Tax=Mycobacterium sp. OTB74 TaxID=1853452 RepID=UPI002473767C|nr:hypothetical protein [Mycobacterium sp. OTB74]MDH6244706.1 hypothetical protein [Mycobacterium sp. OTB74]
MMIRSRLNAGGALASAGMVAVALTVVPPPDSGSPSTTTWSVPIKPVAYSSAMPSVGAMQVYRIGDHLAYVLPLNASLPTKPAASTTAGQPVTAAALATTSTSPSLDSTWWDDLTAQFWQAVAPVVGPVILVGALLFGVLVVAPVEWVIETIYEAIAGPLSLPPTLLSATAPAAATARTLAATPPDPVTYLSENAQILSDGLQKSSTQAGIALQGVLPLLFSVTFLSLLSPPRIPTVLELGAESLDSIWTGTLNRAWGLGYDQVVPGFYIPTDVKPTGNPADAHDVALQHVVDGSVLPATVAAVNQVANNLTNAGLPRFFEQTLLSSEKVGVALWQAGTLARAGLVAAIQEPILAAAEGGDVGAAIQTGATLLQKAVFGDPQAPDVHVDPYDNTSPMAPSMAKLGGLGSVGTAVQQAFTDVISSITPAASVQRTALTATTQQPSATKGLVKNSASAAQSTLGNGTTTLRSAGVDKSTPKTTEPTGKKSAYASSAKNRKAVTRVGGNLKKKSNGDNNNGTP